MAVGNVSRELSLLTERSDISQHHAALRFHVLPLSLLILALVVTTGMAFFRSDTWLLGASFIAGGFLIVSTLLYVGSKRLDAHQRNVSRRGTAKHLGTGTLSAVAGMVSLFVVVGEIGVSLGTYSVLVEQLGFAWIVTGAFWLALAVRDLF